MNPEDLLTDAFRDRTEHTDYPSTPLSAVAARAGAIRARRRRTTALAAAAAVAVVVVPFGVVQAGGWFLHTPRPATTKVHPNAHESTTQPTADTSAAPLSLDALPMGHKPGIDYLVGDTYVTMNGDRITSPAFGTAGAATPVRGGILTATAPRQMGPFSLSKIALVVDGKAQPLGCGTANFAMSTDGVQSAYWLADSCTPGGGGKLYAWPTNIMSYSGAHVATPPGAIDVPVGILRQGVVVNDAGSDQGSGPTPLLIAQDGTTSPIDGLKVATGSDENNDVVSGLLASASDTGAVVDVSSGAVKWRAPGWQLGQFSNDGKYVLAQRLGGSAGYAIFDAVKGTQIALLDPLGNNVSINQTAWDFDDTVLAVASDSQQEAILRFDLQGHPTRATDVRPVTDGNDVYTLATRS